MTYYFSRKMTKFLLYFNTVKYLTFRQILFQLIRKCYGRIVTAHDDFIPSQRPCDIKCDYTLAKYSMLSNMQVTCLGEKHSLNVSIDDGCGFSKLYLYNVHYFDFLNNSQTSNIDAVNAINLWIEKYKYVSGLGGDAYPTSLRIVNWIKWAFRQPIIPEGFSNSLYNQSKLLYSNIEYEIDGNHLFANGKALLFFGVYYEGKWADICFCKGWAIVSKELGKQVLDDGGNFELSPMYHAIMLEDLLDIYIIVLQYNDKYKNVVQFVEPFIQKMINWLNVVSIDNVSYPHFNDSTQNVAPTVEDLLVIADSLNFKISKENCSTLLPDTGYCFLKSSNFSLLCDVANVEAGYIPGHTHADTFSFELWANGTKMICNLGISEYGLGSRRLYERGTSSHSTIEVNGKNSTNVWSGFRVANRAKIVSRQFDKEFNFLKATHNGFKNTLHSRQWKLDDRGLDVIDTLSSEDCFSFKIFYHLTQNVLCEKINETTFKMSVGHFQYSIEFIGIDSVELVDSFYALTYNSLVETKSFVGLGFISSKEYTMTTKLRLLN